MASGHRGAANEMRLPARIHLKTNPHDFFFLCVCAFRCGPAPSALFFFFGHFCCCSPRRRRCCCCCCFFFGWGLFCFVFFSVLVGRRTNVCAAVTKRFGEKYKTKCERNERKRNVSCRGNDARSGGRKFEKKISTTKEETKRKTKQKKNPKALRRSSAIARRRGRKREKEDEEANSVESNNKKERKSRTKRERRRVRGRCRPQTQRNRKPFGPPSTAPLFRRRFVFRRRRDETRYGSPLFGNNPVQKPGRKTR